MLKITLVCLMSQRNKAVAALQSLGLFHVVPVAEPVSAELNELAKQRSELSRVLNAFDSGKFILGNDGKSDTPVAVLSHASMLLDKQRACTERQNVLRPAIEQLEPWGEFSEEILQKLEERGWHTALCSCSKEALPALPDGVFCQVLKTVGSNVLFFVATNQPLAELKLPLANFPQGSNLKALRQEMSQLRQEQVNLRGDFAELAEKSGLVLQEYLTSLEDQVAFAQARDGMGQAGKQLAFLSGYVPLAELDQLRAAANAEGWGLRYEEAQPDDEQVPTKLRIPKKFRMAQLIFDFIGVLPGYNEVDVSIPLLIFLSIFCGILIGDAGYGALFLLSCGACWIFTKSHEKKKKEAIRLLSLMSASILIYGGLTGNWFGVPPEKLPAFFHGIPWFSEDQNDAHVKLLGFVLGAFHLSMARVWAAIVSGNLRKSLGHIGWALFLWGNYFTVKMLLISGGVLPVYAKWMYGVGTVLILTCSVNWTNMGEVIYTPFNFINSLVDVLSYIRLYAVGLSSFFIADSFNAMSMMLWDKSPWMIPLGLFIIFIGHSLNVALAGMSVLVHGIRLNTLEFSGHIGLNWGGKAYQPLQFSQRTE